MTAFESITRLESIHDILHQFDGFIVDQFGVLHDGQKPYPAAVATLKILINSKKRVVILSNSGKRSDINIQRMTQLGFDRSLYSEFVTSGDVAFERVKTLASFKLQARCLLIARDGDRSAVQGLPLELVESSNMADLVIISASEGDRYSEQHYIDVLADAARQKLPCLCTNPDKLMLTRDGIRFGAGRIAELYEELGGSVQWIGKPYSEVYEYALTHLNDIPQHKVLCVGDSLEHDIAGGAKAGLKTLFILGGIHQQMNQASLTQAMALHEVLPDYQMMEFG